MDILTRAEREPLARLEGTTPPSIPKTLSLTGFAIKI
jgi:hypothetical protein